MFPQLVTYTFLKNVITSANVKTVIFNKMLSSIYKRFT